MQSDRSSGSRDGHLAITDGCGRDLVAFEPPALTRDFVIAAAGAVFDIRTGEPAGVKAVGSRGTGCTNAMA